MLKATIDLVTDASKRIVTNMSVTTTVKAKNEAYQAAQTTIKNATPDVRTTLYERTCFLF